MPMPIGKLVVLKANIGMIFNEIMPKIILFIFKTKMSLQMNDIVNKNRGIGCRIKSMQVQMLHYRIL